MKLYFQVLLALLASSSEAQKLYSLVGAGVQGALLRQSENDKHLQLSGSYMNLDDCKSKVSNMNVSPFTFYRGSNQLFFRDMDAQKTVKNSAFYNVDATPWIQGDMHVLNTGRFDNDEGTVVYDLNDFDEAFVANYLYDVYRLAASIVLVGRSNNMQDDDAAECVETFAGAYRDQLKKIARGDASPSPLDYTTAHGLIKDLLTDKNGAELGGKSNQAKLRRKMLDKWTVLSKDGDKRSFNTSSEDMEPVTNSEYDTIKAALKDYYTKTVAKSIRGDSKYFAVQDIARRLNAGTGSLGTDRYYVLIAGESSDPDDDRILDVKRQGKPCVYGYLSASQQRAVDDNVANDADRAVQAYKSLVARSDDHLGDMTMFNEHYSVRERSPYKKSLDLTQRISHSALDDLSEQCGVILANAHARSSRGNKSMGVPASFAKLVAEDTRGRRADFVAEVATVAVQYAKQVDHDYSLFLDSQAKSKLCQAE